MASADELRAKFKLKNVRVLHPGVGAYLPALCEHKFTEAERELAAKSSSRRRRKVGKTDYQVLISLLLHHIP